MWSLHERGMALRQRRKFLKLRMQDLVDHYLSIATISHLETGKKTVGEQKLHLYLKKLGWTIKDLTTSIEGNAHTNNEKTIYMTLQSIETNITFTADPDPLLEKIKKISFQKNDPILALREFLIGKCLYKKGNPKNKKWKFALQHFQQAIRIHDLHPEIRKSNIKSCCLYELGRIFTLQNNIQQAIRCVTEGIQTFINDGERQSYKYALLLSKAIYLEKINKQEESISVLDQMWHSLHEIDSEIELNMYALHALILNKQKKYKQTIDLTGIGIEKARGVKNSNRCFELWTIQGAAYKNLSELNLASICFQTASQFEHQITSESLVAYNYKELGLLYLAQSNLSIAIETLTKALELSRKIKDTYLEFDSLIGLGDCYAPTNPNSIDYYLNAYEIAQDNNKFQERDSIFKLAKCYQQIKDYRNHQKFSALFFSISAELLNGGGIHMSQPDFLNLDPHSMPEPPDR